MLDMVTRTDPIQLSYHYDQTKNPLMQFIVDNGHHRYLLGGTNVRGLYYELTSNDGQQRIRNFPGWEAIMQRSREMYLIEGNELKQEHLMDEQPADNKVDPYNMFL